jgi:imidazolonepropionase-like amidohydrolase
MCGVAGIIPGFSLHGEFDYLLAAGLDSLRILRMAGGEPSRFREQAVAFGRVASGVPADLGLLEQDRLEYHAGLHTMTDVMKDGSWWPRAEIRATPGRFTGRP